MAKQLLLAACLLSVGLLVGCSDATAPSADTGSAGALNLAENQVAFEVPGMT